MLINKVNKKSYLQSLSGNDTKISLSSNLHGKYRTSELYNRSVHVLNTIAIASGYAGPN